MTGGPQKKKRRSRYRFGESQGHKSCPRVGLATKETNAVCFPGVNQEASILLCENTLQSPSASPIPRKVTDNEHCDLLLQDEVEIDLTMCDRLLEAFDDEPEEDQTDANEQISSTSSHSAYNFDSADFEAVPYEQGHVQNERDITPQDFAPSRKAKSALLKISSWRVLWGILVTTGSLKLTKGQYQAMRIIADTVKNISEQKTSTCNENSDYRSAARIDVLPHFSSLYKTYKPVLFGQLPVRGIRTLEEISIRKPGARATSSSQSRSPLAPIHIIKPSEYARADVACEPVFDLMRDASLSNTSNYPHRCVDLWPLISARPWFYGPRTFLSVDGPPENSPANCFAESGDTISITILGFRGLEKELLDNFSQQTGGIESSALVGEILHIWTVHHEKRRNDAEFSHPRPRVPNSAR